MRVTDNHMVYIYIMLFSVILTAYAPLCMRREWGLARVWMPMGVCVYVHAAILLTINTFFSLSTSQRVTSHCVLRNVEGWLCANRMLCTLDLSVYYTRATAARWCSSYVILHHNQSGRSPKVVALFSSTTNISSNIVWLLQLHDTIQIESTFCYQIQ